MQIFGRGSAGPSATAKEQEKPLDYLYLLIVDIFQFIAVETNRYARQQGNMELEVSSAEIATFVGVNVAMGIINMPKILESKSNFMPSMVWFCNG